MHFQGFKCPKSDCHSSFPEIDQLLNHIEDHNREETLSHSSNFASHCCSDCSQSFASDEDLSFHRFTTDHTARADQSDHTADTKTMTREKHLFILECTSCHVAFESHTEEVLWYWRSSCLIIGFREGSFINDVTQILRFSDPPPLLSRSYAHVLCTCVTKSPNPLPSLEDIIYE